MNNTDNNNTDNNKLNIYQKLIEVRKHVDYLQKNNQANNYAYVSSSQVIQSVKDYLNEYNLLLVPEVIDTNVRESKRVNNKGETVTYFTEVNLYYTWINADNPEETLKIKWYSQGVDIAGEKGPGKAYTYGEKYFLLKQFNIATDKDDPDVIANKKKDGNSDKKEHTPEEEKKLARLKNIVFLKVLGTEKKYKDLTGKEKDELDKKMSEFIIKFTEFKGKDGPVSGVDFDKLKGNRLSVSLDRLEKQEKEIIEYLNIKNKKTKK